MICFPTTVIAADSRFFLKNVHFLLLLTFTLIHFVNIHKKRAFPQLQLRASGNQFHTSFTKLFCFSGKIVPGVCFYFGRRIFSSAGAFFLRPAHVYIHRSRIFREMYVCKRKCRIFHSARITSNFFTFPNSGFPSDKECWDASKRLSDYDGLPTSIIVDRAVTWSNQKELLLFHFSFEI